MFHSAHPYLQFLRLWFTVLALLVAWPAHAVSTFSDNNDGTVSDSATSLMWDKCTWGQSGNADCTGSGSTSLYGAGTYTWKQALVLAVTANTANYKGHNDWRLPNRLELESLVDIKSARTTAIDPAFPNTQPTYYRSSTIYKANFATAWVVNFSDGATLGNLSLNYHVRLVRSGQSLDTFDAFYALAPTVTAISPTSGSSAGGTAVTISGSHFTGATAVTIGGVAVSSLTVVNDTTITAITPAGTVGAQNLVVTTPEGAGTGVGLFTYVPPFTKIANNGSELADSAVLGSASGEWACTRDNATGLLWEVKTTSGLRTQNTTYTNYDDLTHAEFNGGQRNPTQAEIDAGSNSIGFGNSIGFVNAVNTDTSALCGFRDWKMPSKDELVALYPKISANTTLFPNTLASYFWSGSPDASNPAKAWYVHFGNGNPTSYIQSGDLLVRLVRSGQSFGTFALTLSASGTGSGGIASSVGGLNCASTAGTTSGTCTTSPGLAEGTSVNLTATAAAGSSTFTGWSGACSGTTSPCTVIMAALKSVTAGFSSNNYTVSFNSNSGSAVTSQSIAYNSTATAPTAPTKTGSTFVGWYSDSGLTTSFAFTTAIVADTPLYAKWTTNNYTASFNPNGGSAVISQTIAYNGTATAPTAPTKTGSTFVGWYSDSGLATSFSFSTVITADTPLYAKWTVNNYTVSFNSNGGSAVISQTIAYNGTATAPTAPTKTGSTFVGWYSDSGLATSFIFSTVITADTPLYAKWTINNYTVSFASNGGSAVISQTIAYNGTATAPTAPTKTGSSFAGWYADSGLSTLFVFSTVITADTPLYAQWTALPNKTVTFSSNGGSGSMSAQSTNVATALTANSFTKAGYTFSGWNTVAVGSGTAYADAASYAFAADVTLYAQWMINNYTISFASNGGSAVTSQTVAYNTAATTPTAPTKTGSSFAGWYSDSGLTASFAFTTAIVADTTLYAKWTITAIAVGLNDTGLTQCTNGGAPVACSAANTGNAAAYPRQDARFGRDAAQAAGQLLPAKTGGGAAGFDFTPLNAAGTVITLTGTPPVPLTTPACVHDNVTNLTWEVKTAANKSLTYTFAQAATYASTTNTAGLCGTGNPWRVPTRRELLSIVHHGTSMPAIDPNYFPNTDSDFFWTSDVYRPASVNAWIVNFGSGGTTTGHKTNDHLRVRLVRSGQ